ncbi:hypothetical protein [Caenimonas soli]|uniref:hypothetical protein n=1 Tax=Caenimonas soli TaxID=2735555 RepID=UPI001556D02E|nr:hypothetical protein [Caenimonas soli]NPC59347.1 hypothetical protein [Caenimonas soli]
MARTSERTIRDAKVAAKAGLGNAVKQGVMSAHKAAQQAHARTGRHSNDLTHGWPIE